MAINVLRRPPLALSKLSANARCKNEGADVITPNEARAMLPDLMKYLLFIILTVSVLWTLCFVLGSASQIDRRDNADKTTKYKALSTKCLFIAVGTQVTRRSNPLVLPRDSRSWPCP